MGVFICKWILITFTNKINIRINPNIQPKSFICEIVGTKWSSNRLERCRFRTSYDACNRLGNMKRKYIRDDWWIIAFVSDQLQESSPFSFSWFPLSLLLKENKQIWRSRLKIRVRSKLATFKPVSPRTISFHKGECFVYLFIYYSCCFPPYSVSQCDFSDQCP